MNPLQLPWIDLAILAALVGSISVSRMRDPERASRWGVVFTGISFSCTFLAWLAFYVGIPDEATQAWSFQHFLFGRTLFALDEVNAPLVPTIALLHFLTGLATADENAPVLVFLVAGGRGDPPGHVQLQGSLGLDRPAGHLDAAPLRRTAQSRPDRAGVRVAHGAVRRPACVRLDARRIERRDGRRPALDGAAVDIGDSDSLRHGAGARLADRLVRARLAGHYAAVRGPAERGLCRRAARAAGGARLGLAVRGFDVAVYRGLCGGHGYDPARSEAILFAPVLKPCLAGAGRHGAAHRASP